MQALFVQSKKFFFLPSGGRGVFDRKGKYLFMKRLAHVKTP
jgi:hypothetical protein